ncbi:MAG: hypothetical protein WBF75_06000 [Pseudonocardiaceae bacterium]
MYELSRVRLFSVGPPGARYQDVQLDLRGVGPVVQAVVQEDLFALDDLDRAPRRPSPASVLFLENGGGKSVLIKLIFSVMLPGRRQVVGTTNTRVLEKFVLAADVAHVVLEWMHTGTGDRLVTGKVSEWRGHVVSSDSAKLSDAWYSFRPTTDLHLDSLPFTVDRRRVTMSRFSESLHEAHRLAPELQLAWETGHRDWTEHLVDLGLDPELFRYQRAMNAGEGEAAEAFSFRTDEAFVDFLLRAVLDEEDPRGLTDVIEGYATKLAQRADLTLEREFIDGALKLLRPLAAAEQEAGAARDIESGAWQEAQQLAASITARHVTEIDRLAIVRAHAEDVAGAARTAALEERRLQEISIELNRLVAELRLREAERARDEQTTRLETVSQLCAAWRASGPVLREREASAEASRLRTVMAAEEERARPALRARAVATGRLARALDRLATEADASAVAAAERADALDAQVAAQRAEQLRLTGDTATHRAQAEQADKALADIAVRHGQAVRDGLIGADDDVATAAAQARSAQQDTAAEVEAALTEQDELRTRRRDADTELGTARQVEAPSQAAVTDAEKLCDEADATRRELAGESRLAELLGTEQLDPQTDSAAVLERLGAAITEAEAQRGALQIEQQRDSRALRALGAGGLLPEPTEVEEALAVLEAQGITAYSGWRYLASLPDEDRPAMLERRPHLVGGVLLNDPAETSRARSALEDAKLLPCAVVAVGVTRAMHDASAVPGADFVVPPNPAMFDEIAAARERAALTAAGERRGLRMATLAEMLGTDRALIERLRQWQQRYPPGRLDELSAALASARASAEIAAARRATAEQIVAGIDQRAEDLAAALPELRTAEVTARNRADRLAALEVETAKRPALAEALRVATAAADQANELARRTGETAGRLQAEAGELRRTGDRQSGIARNAREELAQLPAHDDTDEPGPDAEEPLGVLRAEFRKADADYAAVQVGADLQARFAAAEKQAEQARLAVGEIDRPARDRAATLLSTPDGADAASRAAATEQAERALDTAREQLQQAVTDVALRAQAYRQYKPQARSLEPYGPPRDIAHGTALISQIEQDTRVAQAKATELARKQDVVDAEVSRVTASVEGFRAVVAGLDDLAPGQPDPAVPAVPLFEGDVDAALTRWRKSKATLREAAALREGAERTVREAADAVAQHAQQSRFDTVTSPVRRHILGVSRTEMPRLAGEWDQALQPRLRSLDDDLGNIGRHRAGIVARLHGMVSAALRTLRLAQRLSRLPEGLSDWSGQEFLRIRFDDIDEAVLLDRLGEVVDQAAAGVERGGKDQRDGMSLLLHGVRAAMPKGVRVEMLKPDVVLRTERVRISEIRDVFSGGQQLTAAIILYCTMAALRANDRGEGRRRHSGVLFLDNPIGRASAGYLLELQLGVAKALGVQLIYTTGLFDAGALSVFPLIIRLRNDADLRAGLKYLSVDNQIRRVLDQLDPPDDTGQLSAVRMFRRPAPAQQ